MLALRSVVLVTSASSVVSPSPPKLVPIAPAELVWDQHVDACPGRNKFGHAGEQPDSMPLAWHNPLSGQTSLITANDWGTFAKIAPRLSDLRSGAQQADCSHRVFTSINSSDPSTYANHQWMQSVHMWPNGTGISLIHNEFHGDQVPANSSICSYHWPNSTAPNSLCQLWSTGVGFTQDGGDHWQLVASPPEHVAFALPRRYTVDQPMAGFGALGALVQLQGFYYGHVMEIKAGRTAASPNSSGVCVFRTADPSDPRSYRGWNGSAWATTWADPYTDDQHGHNTGDHACAVVPTAGSNAHPNPRQFSGDWMPLGWPTHVMLGWPEGSKNQVAYAFSDWDLSSAEPFTSWSTPQYLDITGWVPPAIDTGENLMYPALLDADSPELGRGGANGLSYALVGNKSLALYYVVSRSYIFRLPVAWVSSDTPAPQPPFPPAPPSPLNPKDCRTFLVIGAGRADVNGLYKLDTHPAAAEVSHRGHDLTPTFTKDARHQLYYFGDNWKLAHKGVPPVYYVATDTHGGSTQVPELSWKGQMPYPKVACTE